MADKVLEIVRYFYRNPRLSDAAVSHAFRYLSAVTGVKFLADAGNPDIFSAAGMAIPSCTRLTVIDNPPEGPRTFVREMMGGDAWRSVLSYDPIEIITRKLCISIRTGPYSEKADSVSMSRKPVLTQAIDDLLTVLSVARVISKPERTITLWPQYAPFAIAVTHDIDIARRSVPGSLKLLFSRDIAGRWRGLFDSTLAALKIRHNPYDNLRQWINVESELGLKSTFFIFAGQRRHLSDPVYELENLSTRMRSLKDNGFEIGLHTSIGSHTGSGILEARSALASAGGCDIAGLRPHYLSAFFPEYWKAAAEAGLSYSSSLGFDDRIGFLDGVDLPFFPFDKSENKAIDIVEIPIAIMDCGLIGRLQASSDDVLQRGLDLIDQTASSGGLLTLDWHQRTLYNRDYPGWAQLLLRLIHHARDKGAYIGKMSELASLVRNRFRESV